MMRFLSSFFSRSREVRNNTETTVETDAEKLELFPAINTGLIGSCVEKPCLSFAGTVVFSVIDDGEKFKRAVNDSLSFIGG